MSATCIIILVSIVVVIVLGYLLKVNFGLMGIAAAFICGVCLAGMSAGKVMNMWSTKLFFQMFSITFFYHRLTRAHMPDSTSFRRFSSFSP